jgi:hypothetical protein
MILHFATLAFAAVAMAAAGTWSFLRIKYIFFPFSRP